MKAKNQHQFTSEQDAKEKLIVYVYEYLIHSGAKQAAEMFKESIGYPKDIKINEAPGFLLDWWCVFWDLYCAAPERRHTQPESSSEARAFHDLMRSTPMSPSITQTPPPQHPQQIPQPQYVGGHRYGPPQGPIRGPPPRMQMPPQHGPHPGGPPPGFMPTSSPRYAQHSGPPPPPHPMSQGPMGFGPGPGPDQMGPSPGLNRLTPVSAPPQAVVGPPPPNGPPPPPQMVAMPPGQQLQVANQVPSPQVQGAGPPRNASQGSAAGWQGNVNYNVSSPATQACYSGPGSNQPSQGGSTMMLADGGMMEVKSSPITGGEPSTPHPDEYVMPVPFSQEASDQCDSEEILKLKQSMQEDSNKIYEKDQSEFNLGDYSDSQNKWS